MTIMVTGGAGYIGSHTCVELISAGYPVLIYDNFCNSNIAVVERIERITGTRPEVVRGDVCDSASVEAALIEHQCSAVVHFAGLKAVADSVRDPLRYYENNVVGSMSLVKAMQGTNVCKLVFSSSATVYGNPVFLPLTEDHPKSPYSPYGRTKLVVEGILGDLAIATGSLRVAILRYFNPVGSHESGLIGEDPRGVPGNIMPFISQVAVGRRPHLSVYGNDYDTPDGTGVRDYVHVMDLAAGHVRALKTLETQPFINVNLGTGRGSSVLDLVDAFKKASGREIPLVFAPRRDGDVASYYASTNLAERLLGWRATRNLASMCVDTWNWQRKNPCGYRDVSANVSGANEFIVNHIPPEATKTTPVNA
jgi:UDP-glucose 4-epimerase